MSTWLVFVVTLLYFGVFVSEAYNRNLGMAVVFLGYAFANFGMMMLTSQ